MKHHQLRLGLLLAALAFLACSHRVVSVEVLSNGTPLDMSAEEWKKISGLRKTENPKDNEGIREVVEGEAPRIPVEEYLAKHPEYARRRETLYHVGLYDVMAISVYGEEDLSMPSVAVGSDGDIPFPLIGRVKVAGLTPQQVEETISRKLSDDEILLDAQVTVSVVEYNSRKYSVFGKVPTAGTFPLKAGDRLLDAFSNMGNIDWGSASKEAMIIRTEPADNHPDRKIIIMVDLQALLKGDKPGTNLLLKDQDIIYVPEGKFYYLLGQVNGAGAYKIPDEGVKLAEAIARAGGFTQLAARNRTRIIRVEDGVEKIITVKVDAIMRSGRKIQDIALMPNDIVIVPESFF